MVSGSFGQCTCGAKRADHSEGALAHGTGGAAAREAKAYGKTKQVLRSCYTLSYELQMTSYTRLLPRTCWPLACLLTSACLLTAYSPYGLGLGRATQRVYAEGDGRLCEVRAPPATRDLLCASFLSVEILTCLLQGGTRGTPSLLLFTDQLTCYKVRAQPGLWIVWRMRVWCEACGSLTLTLALALALSLPLALTLALTLALVLTLSQPKP